MRHPARPTHVGLDHARFAKLVLELWDEAVHDAQKAHEFDNGNQQYADQVGGRRLLKGIGVVGTGRSAAGERGEQEAEDVEEEGRL